MRRRQASLCLFVYGTLKSGHQAHSVYCRGAELVGEAKVLGVLRLHRAGYPVLVVPKSTIICRAGADAARDGLIAESGGAKRLRLSPADSRWRPIRGEILLFRHPERDLPEIDTYEGIGIEQPALYARVLVPVRGSPVRVAWTFAAACERAAASLAPFPGDSWP